jgi:hypothetical protein
MPVPLLTCDGADCTIVVTILAEGPIPDVAVVGELPEGVSALVGPETERERGSCLDL